MVKFRPSIFHRNIDITPHPKNLYTMNRFAITLSLIALSLIAWFSLGHAKKKAQDAPPQENPITVKVVVLNFNPIVADQKKRLHEVCGWADPKKLADGYLADVKKASRGFIQYEIVEWRDIDGFPIKTDGFRYTTESYLDCHEKKSKWHEPDLSDYPKMIEEHGIAKLIDDGTADELWIFGGPYFGFHESSMAGPEAYYINGGTYDKVPSKRRFAIMGFSYERGVAEMLHNLCHRTESTMTHTYGGWKVEELTSNWARFAANLHQSGTAAVGTCHYPPNGQSGYDYANPREVFSTAGDWLNYPNLTGAQTKVSCETWGGPDHHRNYMNWWFKRLPHVSGTNAEDNKLNNWWKYVFAINQPEHLK